MKKFSFFLCLGFLILFSQNVLAQLATDNQTTGKATKVDNNTGAQNAPLIAAPNEAKQANEIDDLPALETMFAAPAPEAPVQPMPTQQAPAQLAPVQQMPAQQAPAQLAPLPIPTQGSAANQGLSEENKIAEAKKLGPVIVGRISELDGEIQRYVEETKEWVMLVKNTPLGVRDSIFSGEETKAEVVFPNNVVWRMGGNTHAVISKLDSEVLEITANAGLARFANFGKAMIIYNTDYGTVQAEGNVVFEIFISEEAVEVKNLRGTGTVNFIKGGEKFEVVTGKGSVLADNEAVTAGNGYPEPDSWSTWNNQKDGIWGERVRKTKKFVKHLPPELRLDAYMLEENGQWVTAVIEGTTRVVYRPSVAADWQPFVNGQWVDYYGDQTFVSYDPFGYVTHHYGNWLMTNGVWVWAPPYSGTVVVGSPYLPIDYAYYPGRVSWVSTVDYVGWVPLYYTEPYCPAYWGGYYGYYGHHGYYPYHDHHGHYYGHDYHHVDIHVSGLHYGGHGCYVGHNNFYGHHGGYGGVRFNGDHRSFSNLRAANRFDGSRFGGKRFQMSAQKASFRPNKSFGEKMRNNNFASRMGGKRENAGTLRNNLQNARRGNLADRPARSIMDRKGGGGNKILGGGKAFGGGERKLGGGNKILGGGERKLGGGERKVISGGDRKLGGGNKILGGGDRKLGGGERKLGGGERKLGGGERKVISGGERKLGGGDRKIGGGDRPRMNNDRPRMQERRQERPRMERQQRQERQQPRMERPRRQERQQHQQRVDRPQRQERQRNSGGGGHNKGGGGGGGKWKRDR